MKILFLVSSMDCGGAERVASLLVNHWSSQGYRVTLMATFSGHGTCFYNLSPDVELVYLADLVRNESKTRMNKIKRLHRLRQFIKTYHPDVIVSFLYNVNVATIIASLGLGIPVLISERTDPFSISRSFKSKLLCRYVYKLATVLIVQTQTVLAKYIALGWSNNNLRVIANPISELIQTTVHTRNTTTTKIILSVGRLDEGKQFGVLISIFAKLADKYTNWTLRIIGDGPKRADLIRQIDNLQLGSRIELKGQLTHIHKELNQADIFAFTSRYEGFPNALLEAMAAGLACVTFDCPCGPRELTLDGHLAELIPLNDEQLFGLALERLMLDANLRESLGSQASASVFERFAIKKIMDQWDTLFHEIKVKN